MDEETEVARIRRLIEAEHRASVWALTGLSTGNAQHAFISRRMGHMEISHQRLSQLIGEERAVEFICEVFEQSPATGEPFLTLTSITKRIEIRKGSK